MKYIGNIMKSTDVVTLLATGSLLLLFLVQNTTALIDPEVDRICSCCDQGDAQCCQMCEELTSTDLDENKRSISNSYYNSRRIHITPYFTKRSPPRVFERRGGHIVPYFGNRNTGGYFGETVGYGKPYQGNTRLSGIVPYFNNRRQGQPGMFGKRSAGDQKKCGCCFYAPLSACCRLCQRSGLSPFFMRNGKRSISGL